VYRPLLSILTLEEEKTVLRKLIVVALAALLIVSGSSVVTAHVDPTAKLIFLPIGQRTVLVNGQPKSTDAPANIIQDRTMVPARFISETIGATVGWDPSDRRVTITQGTRKVEIWIGKTEARVNGASRKLDVAPVIQNDRTMVPLRFVSENLGLDVGWDEKARGIYILNGHVDNVVVIKDGNYNDSNVIQVHVGKPVVVINLDDTPHSLTDRKFTFDSGSLKKGFAGTFTPMKAGSFEIYCEWHPGMGATLIVR